MTDTKAGLLPTAQQIGWMQAIDLNPVHEWVTGSIVAERQECIDAGWVSCEPGKNYGRSKVAITEVGRSFLDTRPAPSPPASAEVVAGGAAKAIAALRSQADALLREMHKPGTPAHRGLSVRLDELECAAHQASGAAVQVPEHRRYMDAIDAEQWGKEFLNAVIERRGLWDDPECRFTDHGRSHHGDTTVRALWKMTQLVAMVSIFRDDMNFAQVTCIEFAAAPQKQEPE